MTVKEAFDLFTSRAGDLRADACLGGMPHQLCPPTSEGLLIRALVGWEDDSEEIKFEDFADFERSFKSWYPEGVTP